MLARIPEEELFSLFSGYGYEPVIVSGDEPMDMHGKLAKALDDAYATIRAIQRRARSPEAGAAAEHRPRWPMLILRTPKGWTGPKVVDGKQIEGTWRAHQVPLESVRTNPEHLQMLEAWMRRCETGTNALRADVPTSWIAGDKTGSGDNATRNDLAFFRPPHRAPIVVAAYLTGAHAVDLDGRNAALADVGRVVAEAFA